MKQLRALDQALHPALASIVSELRVLLRSDRVLAYGVSLEPDGFALEFAHGSGFQISNDDLNRVLAAGMRQANGRPWALYDPRMPDAAQRNVAINMPPPAQMSGPAGDPLFQRLGVSKAKRSRLVHRMQTLNDHVLRRIGLADLDVCRVLVCDGPYLLAWVGAARPEPFTERERTLLARLTSPLRGRLRTERRLDTARFHASALTALLEALPAEAILFDVAGRVRHANTAARALRGADLTHIGHDLARVIRGGHAREGDFEITEISTPGLPRHFLAIRARPPSEPSERIESAAVRWGLTPRQTEVLALLVLGEPTKNIATQLRCVERTVEAHITRILQRAGADNRAALIAKYWQL